MDIQELINNAAKVKMEKDLNKLNNFLHQNLFAGLSLLKILANKEDINVLIDKEYDTFRGSFWNVLLGSV